MHGTAHDDIVFCLCIMQPDGTRRDLQNPNKHMAQLQWQQLNRCRASKPAKPPPAGTVYAYLLRLRIYGDHGDRASVQQVWAVQAAQVNLA